MRNKPVGEQRFYRRGATWPGVANTFAMGQVANCTDAAELHPSAEKGKEYRSSVPGPLGDKPQTCIGFVFQGKQQVSFPDLPSLSSWFHAGVRATREWFGLPPSRRDPFRKCQKMVLTHMDLNMRNILVGKDARIWVIDWDRAGFYPEWFEYMNLSFVSMMSTPISWQHCIPFITDPYFECIRWMQATD